MSELSGLTGLDPLTLLTRALVALGPLVVVPLGLTIVLCERPLRLARLARLLAPFAALCFAAALTQPAGPVASVLTLPWLLTGALVGLVGLARFLTRDPQRRFDLPALATDIGCLYLPVGAIWALVSRSDVAVLGYSGTAALLTAAHFHFAGFGACVLVGSLVPRDRLDRLAIVLTVLSVGILAIGITLSRTLEIAAAWTLVAGVLLTARLLWRTARDDHGLPRVLARVSAIASVVAAGFAAQFATAGFASLDASALRRMLFFHATLNSVGFVIGGLSSRALRPAPSRVTAAEARSAAGE